MASRPGRAAEKAVSPSQGAAAGRLSGSGEEDALGEGKKARRLFVAIPASKEIADLLLSLVPPNGRVAKNPHLTLRFIGQVAEINLGPLKKSLSLVNLPPVSLLVKGVGFFKQGAFWAGIEGDQNLTRLKESIDSRVDEALGLKRVARAFKPHLTVARLKGKPDFRLWEFIRSQSERKLGSFSAFEFGLYESILAPTGATHRLLEKYALKA
ncbi:MAG: RNA 2',3'-cyclic phosphodiesterase [Deltaproteobacteria bacterium]|nr:RNA 2',3'-cyclic phosphodiesterase [Deltaproteobacteria bacterium]